MDEEEVVARLRAAGCVYAEEEAALILEAEADIEDLVARRVAGEPLEYVVGWAEFCGMRISVEPGVFVPRRRTEALVETAVRRAPGARVVVDLCCGSGALGLAFAHRVPVAELHAADLDLRAVACARRNGVAQAHQGDLFGALPPHLAGRIDVLLANVPYVPTEEIALLHREARDHEPRPTLDGGPDGLDLARRVVDGAATWLAPGGQVFIEASDEQAPLLAEAMYTAGLVPVIDGQSVIGMRTV